VRADDRSVDPVYVDARLAGLYDGLNGRAASDDFYLGYGLQAASVLDVGCGPGALLCRARDGGHAGDLVGVDGVSPGRAGGRGSTHRRLVDHCGASAGRKDAITLVRLGLFASASGRR
jgi:hypothetical protein